MDRKYDGYPARPSFPSDPSDSKHIALPEHAREYGHYPAAPATTSHRNGKKTSSRAKEGNLIFRRSRTPSRPEMDQRTLIVASSRRPQTLLLPSYNLGEPEDHHTLPPELSRISAERDLSPVAATRRVFPQYDTEGSSEMKSSPPRFVFGETIPPAASACHRMLRNPQDPDISSTPSTSTISQGRTVPEMPLPESGSPAKIPEEPRMKKIINRREHDRPATHPAALERRNSVRLEWNPDSARLRPILSHSKPKDALRSPKGRRVSWDIAAIEQKKQKDESRVRRTSSYPAPSESISESPREDLYSNEEGQPRHSNSSSSIVRHVVSNMKSAAERKTRKLDRVASSTPASPETYTYPAKWLTDRSNARKAGIQKPRLNTSIANHRANDLFESALSEYAAASKDASIENANSPEELVNERTIPRRALTLPNTVQVRPRSISTDNNIEAYNGKTDPPSDSSLRRAKSHYNPPSPSMAGSTFSIVRHVLSSPKKMDRRQPDRQDRNISPTPSRQHADLKEDENSFLQRVLSARESLPSQSIDLGLAFRAPQLAQKSIRDPSLLQRALSRPEQSESLRNGSTDRRMPPPAGRRYGQKAESDGPLLRRMISRSKETDSRPEANSQPDTSRLRRMLSRSKRPDSSNQPDQTLTEPSTPRKSISQFKATADAAASLLRRAVSRPTVEASMAESSFSPWQNGGNGRLRRALSKPMVPDRAERGQNAPNGPKIGMLVSGYLPKAAAVSKRFSWRGVGRVGEFRCVVELADGRRFRVVERDMRMPDVLLLDFFERKADMRVLRVTVRHQRNEGSVWADVGVATVSMWELLGRDGTMSLKVFAGAGGGGNAVGTLSICTRLRSEELIGEICGMRLWFRNGECIVPEVRNWKVRVSRGGIGGEMMFLGDGRILHGGREFEKLDIDDELVCFGMGRSDLQKGFIRVEWIKGANRFGGEEHVMGVVELLMSEVYQVEEGERFVKLLWQNGAGELASTRLVAFTTKQTGKEGNDRRRKLALDLLLSR